MLHDKAHPSDLTLILALDRELSAGRQLALDRHLAECERCRSRWSAIASMTDETARMCRDTAPAMAPDALRQRLQADLAELGAQWDLSMSFRVRKAIATLPFVVRVSAAVALIAVVLPVMRSALDTISVTTRIDAESLPIRALTPGATSRLDREALCAGRLPARSPIAPSVRQIVLRQYRMEHVSEREYELDYLITPELGGTADPRNLWPERYAPGVWNARVKDDLERLLPQLVCEGTLDLVTAQQAIAENWIAAYKKYLRTDHPIATHAGVVDDDDERDIGGSEASADGTHAPVSQVGPRRVSFAVSLEADTM